MEVQEESTGVEEELVCRKKHSSQQPRKAQPVGHKISGQLVPVSHRLLPARH